MVVAIHVHAGSGAARERLGGRLKAGKEAGGQGSEAGTTREGSTEGWRGEST